MGLQNNLDRVTARFAELRDGLASGALDSATFAKHSKEFAELEPIAEAVGALRAAEKEAADLAAMLADPAIDSEMRALAESEVTVLRERIPAMEREIQIMLLPKDEADARNVIVEIRAGAGGDEAALFAAELLDMYKRYAALRGWKYELISLSENDLGGVREASASIAGKDVFARLKYESGVHRVQRVPKTETQGRIHTSTATVAVLPEAEEVDIHIEEKDLRIDVFRASGPGGQSVNTTDSAVRITHIPSGLVVSQQDEKSQHKNKAKALKVLRARLYEMERMKREQERAQSRKSQVGTGDRSERVRTYNFPQGRVTEHRVNLTLYKIEQVMLGLALDEIIDALAAEDQAEKLANWSWN
jgi:peptide chain release factor 1